MIKMNNTAVEDFVHTTDMNFAMNYSGHENATLRAFVVYSSKAEQVLSSCAMIFSTSVTVFAQSVIIAAIWRTESLHESYFYIMAAYCAADMIMVSLAGSHYTVQFIYGYPPFPAWYHKVITVFGLSLAFGLIYHIALISYDRYIFFCRPYAYLRLFNTRRLMFALAIIYFVPLVYCTVTEIMIGRVYHASVLTYNLPESLLQPALQFGFITLPSTAVTIFSAVKVWKLIQMTVAPPDAGNQAAPVVQAKKVVRMILLISGKTFLKLIILLNTIT